MLFRSLAEILPHRALTSEEVREMLNTLVAVLVYLHGRNLTHGHIKPSNILAIGDQLKVSSDSIQPIDELREMRRERDVYDAPEIPSSAYTPAADIWSLGVTLVETFAQQPAVLPFEENADPVIPPSVREPFLEIARQAVPDGYGNSYFWVKPERIVPLQLVREVGGRFDVSGKELRPFSERDARAAITSGVAVGADRDHARAAGLDDGRSGGGSVRACAADARRWAISICW